MATIEKHKPGEFCWIELATTDQEAAKTFYGSLFDWGVNDFPMGPDEVYSMFTLEGRHTAAAFKMGKGMPAGVPPHWSIYVTTDDADQAASRTAELGGKVCKAPFDIMDAGRMAVLSDPTGAMFSVWQAQKHQGTGIAGVPGTLCWADLNTSDPARAVAFYSDLFGWKIDAGEKDPSGYLHITNGEEMIGGVPPAKQHDPKVPPHWLAYFHVSDCDATAAKAKEMGGKFLLPPLSMQGVGRIAVIADPQGAVFALYQPPA